MGTPFDSYDYNTWYILEYREEDKKFQYNKLRYCTDNSIRAEKPIYDEGWNAVTIFPAFLLRTDFFTRMLDNQRRMMNENKISLEEMKSHIIAYVAAQCIHITTETGKFNN